ncbi:hypothetical protein [Pontibacter rugosus]
MRGRAVTNRPLVDLYQTVAMAFIPDYTPSRLLLEVRDPGQLLPEGLGDSLAAWEQEHFYSYDLIVPATEADTLYTRMLEDLNKNSPTTGLLKSAGCPAWSSRSRAVPGGWPQKAAKSRTRSTKRALSACAMRRSPTWSTSCSARKRSASP